MDRIIDKAIVAICCTATLSLTSYSTDILAGMLIAVSLGALRETDHVPLWVRNGLAFGYLAVTLVFPGFVVFLPLVAYDCNRMGSLPARLCWVIPLLAASQGVLLPALFFSCMLALAACFLSWRTGRTEAERDGYLRFRDELRELSLSLEQKNRDLQEKQDYEVRLATLGERSRIAREIHDNVGHLLTRSVLQVEALQVVHAEDPQVRKELEQVGATLHEAFDTVRDSVHDLHDDSFDLYTQLLVATRQSSIADAVLDYQAQSVPLTVGYCLLAIAREALANTARHSDATKVEVSITEYPAFWQMIVSDNGSKDPFKAVPLHGGRFGGRASGNDALVGLDAGIGLKTMEERVRSVGGVLRIDYDKGMRIFVSVPNADYPKNMPSGI